MGRVGLGPAGLGAEALPSAGSDSPDNIDCSVDRAAGHHHRRDEQRPDVLCWTFSNNAPDERNDEEGIREPVEGNTARLRRIPGSRCIPASQ